MTVDEQLFEGSCLCGQVRYVGRHHPWLARRLAGMLARALGEFGGASACATQFTARHP